MEKNLFGKFTSNNSKTTPFFEASSSLIQEIVQSRENIQHVTIPSDCITLIAKICSHFQVDGVRADISLTKGARALASFQNCNSVTKEDIIFLVPYILAHRIPLDNPDEITRVIDRLVTTESAESKENESKNEAIDKTPLIKGSKQFLHRTIENSVKFGSIMMITYVLSLIIVRILSVPSLLPVIFGLVLIWGICSFLLYLWVQKRHKLMTDHGLIEKKAKSTSYLKSFSQVKSFRLSDSTKEDKRDIKGKVEFDLEEDQSNRGKILRFVGLQRRRGLISLSDRLRFWIMILGLLIIVITIVVYTMLILLVPPEFWLAIFFFVFILFTMGYLRQLNQDEWKIRRAADVGASPGETSKKVSDLGIGSHVSLLEFKRTMQNIQSKSEQTILSKLAKLDVIGKNNEPLMGKSFMSDFGSTGIVNHSQRVLATKIPRQPTRIDPKRHTMSGKRALSFTSLQTGRVIGDKPFKDFPKSFHVLATIINSLRRNPPHFHNSSHQSLQLEMSDVREKVFTGCAAPSVRVMIGWCGL